MKIINKKIFSNFSKLRLNNHLEKRTSVINRDFYFYNESRVNDNNFNMFYENKETGDFYYIKNDVFKKYCKNKVGLLKYLKLIGVNKEDGDEK